MKVYLEKLIIETLKSLDLENILSPGKFQLEYSRDKKHGDFACNVALLIAKHLQLQPRQLAEKIVNRLSENDTSCIQKIELAGPGFINFFIKPSAWFYMLNEIFEKGEQFGHSDYGSNQTVLLEFVSANPTGPLHVGHGRSAAYGDSLGRVLKAVGYNVCTEYYVNDAGRQMDILAISVWLRYLELSGEQFTFPSNAYRGKYIYPIAEALHQKYSNCFLKKTSLFFTDLPLDEPAGGDKEVYIDAVIQKAKSVLGTEAYRLIFQFTLNTILEDIKNDLKEFNIDYHQWFSEASLFKNGLVNTVIDKLKLKQVTYEKNGALWFKSTQFGDDKDRVLVRENGQPTYFAADAAYRYDLLNQRKFSQLINVLGADHHGYVARIRAAIEALGFDPSKLIVPIVQFAVLYRGKERVQMSTRSGDFVTLRDLRKEVGTDAARFFYVMRKAEQHMDFDLELAKSTSNDNPVYYIQYAYARICSVFRQMKEKKLIFEKEQAQFPLLKEEEEIYLATLLNRYPETLQYTALNYAPHTLAHYARELAHGLHTYYNSHPFLVDDINLRNARLCLILAVKQVIGNALNLLGVSAPDVM